MKSVLEIKLNSISENAKTVVDLCARKNINVLGVTKGFSANPRIVDAMLRGGIEGLADSRLENIASLRRKGYEQEITLLRIPCASDAKKVVELTDYSLNSEPYVIRALSESAIRLNKVHNIIVMIDVGDRREGILPEDAVEMIKKILLLKGIRISGLGTNMGCYGGILPTTKNLQLLLEIKKMIEKGCGIEVKVLSGGGTSSLKLVAEGRMPEGINQLRVGEGILLGTDTTHNTAIDELKQDAFTLRSEIVELKEKSSVPIGIVGWDSFGRRPEFVDHGIRKRAIIPLGRQDVNIDGIIPADSKMHILGASSDHMLIDVTDVDDALKVGDWIEFRLNYQGLLFLNNSKYVKKQYI